MPDNQAMTTNPNKEKVMKTRTPVGCTVDVGRSRVLREENSNRVYYSLVFADGSSKTGMSEDIVWCKRSFDAYNIGVNRYGRRFLNMVNLESGELVMGSR